MKSQLREPGGGAGDGDHVVLPHNDDEDERTPARKTNSRRVILAVHQVRAVHVIAHTLLAYATKGHEAGFRVAPVSAGMMGLLQARYIYY